MAKVGPELMNEMLNPLLQNGETYEAAAYAELTPKFPIMMYFGALGALLGGAPRPCFIGLTQSKINYVIFGGLKNDKIMGTGSINLNEITKVKISDKLFVKRAAIKVEKKKTVFSIRKKLKNIPDQERSLQVILDRLTSLSESLKQSA